MIIIGHPLVDFKPFYKIGDIKSIKNTPPNSVVLFEFNENKISYFRYCRENDISFAVEVKDIKELLIANANKASFALVNAYVMGRDTEELKSEGTVILVNIGADLTNVTFVRDGIYHSARDISTAGDYYTHT